MSASSWCDLQPQPALPIITSWKLPSACLYCVLQLEEGKRETERLKMQFENERKRRWRLLEEKADFEQLVRELYGWEDAAGKGKGVVLLAADGNDAPTGSSPTALSPPVGADLNTWVAKFRQSVALVQVVKEKRCVADLLC
jgi:hypothetical protein